MEHRLRGLADPKPLGYPRIYHNDSDNKRVPGARDVGYLMNGADRKKGASKKKKDELVGAGSKFSS